MTISISRSWRHTNQVHHLQQEIDFLQTILKRSDDELTRRVYMAQKDDPVKGDFVNLIKSDLEMFDGSIDQEYIQLKSKSSLKEEIKEKIRKAAFKYLKEKQNGHSKIKGIQYTHLQTQTYMTSPLFSNEEVNLLHGLRSRSVNVKCNFRTRYQNQSSAFSETRNRKS